MRTTILLVLSVSTLVGASLANGTALDDDRPADAAKSAPPQYGVIPFSAEEAGKLQEAWATHLGTGKTVKNTLGMELVLIPPGKFRMELVDATLTRPFYLGKTEVTRVQWTAVMVETPRPDLKDPNRPMTDVSWYDAKTFCERLTAEEKNGTYRLPSEAEWEFACRAGTATRFSFGNDGSKLGEYAWISTNTRDSGEPYPHDVATKKPNPFGLFDMHGNVWELCDGHYTSDPSKEERPHLCNPDRCGWRPEAAGTRIFRAPTPAAAPNSTAAPPAAPGPSRRPGAIPLDSASPGLPRRHRRRQAIPTGLEPHACNGRPP